MSRILIVEADPLMRWALAETLADHGCDVVQAADGRTACAAVGEGDMPPDVIFLDLELRGSSSLVLFSTLRSLTTASRIILMTEYATPDLTRLAREQGAHDVLAKPFDMTAVFAAVERTDGAADPTRDGSIASAAGTRTGKGGSGFPGDPGLQN